MQQRPLALCSTKFPTDCAAASRYVNGTFSTIAQIVASNTPKSVVAGSDSICVMQTRTCTVANPCSGTLSLTSGTVVNYGAMTGSNGVTSAATCTTVLAGLPASHTVNTLCTTNNCNAPTTSSAAGALSGATTVAAAMMVAALAVAKM